MQLDVEDDESAALGSDRLIPRHLDLKALPICELDACGAEESAAYIFYERRIRPVGPVFDADTDSLLKKEVSRELLGLAKGCARTDERRDVEVDATDGGRKRNDSSCPCRFVSTRQRYLKQYETLTSLAKSASSLSLSGPSRTRRSAVLNARGRGPFSGTSLEASPRKGRAPRYSSCMPTEVRAPGMAACGRTCACPTSSLPIRASPPSTLQRPACAVRASLSRPRVSVPAISTREKSGRRLINCDEVASCTSSSTVSV